MKRQSSLENRILLFGEKLTVRIVRIPRNKIKK